MKKSFILLVLACSFVGASAQTGKGYDRANMNLSVNPGDDFVEYATGTFIKNNPLRPDQTSNGSFVDLYELNQKQINELILQFANNPQEKGSLGQKIGTLYNQMMDSVGRDKKGYEPIKPLLERVRAIKDRKEYVRVCSDIDRKGGSTLMLGLGVGADMRQADMNIVSIGQAGLGLGTRDYYLNDDPQTTAIREAYKQCGKSFFMLVGYDEATAQKKMDAVYAIEKRLAEPWYSQVKLRDINANYHKMSFQELVRDFPGIDWTTVFWISGFPAFDYVDVGQPEPIHEVEKIYADTPLEDLKSYAELNVISHAAGLLSADFRKVQFTFRKVISGQQQDDPMWKRATNLVNSVMGEPIGKMYCEKYFPESSKNRMLQLVHNLQTALSQRIDEATWMSAETTNLEISDTLSLTENLDNVSEFFLLDNLRKKVNKPVDKSEWFMTPQTINAYYNPTSNEICFPAGILQPPFFDPEADDALNYGAIGGVIGHEMSHGFDDQGSQFDKTGNQRNWWTEQDKKNFDQRTQVLVDHFSNIEVVNGKKVNGKLTLGENIGDNGGLNIALRAMRNTGNTAVIDGFTADQRFFLAWARVWAGTSRPEYQEMLITIDPHSPEFARVNGALPMIDEWYTAFNIKKGKLFVPKKKRAHIW